MERELIKIPMPRNLAATLANVRAEVEKENGSLVGDEKSGTITTYAFTKNDIQGEYSLQGNEIIVKIIKKPMLVPFSILRKEMLEIFTSCAVDE